MKEYIQWFTHLFTWENFLAGIIPVMTFLNGFLGGYDDLLDCFIWLVIADYITGLLKAGKCHSLSSRIGKIGIVKKFLMLLMIGICHKLDLAFNLNGALGVRTLMITLLIGEELISLAENLDTLGFPIFKKIRDRLLQNKKI
ncbi:toxin secretion/phage lysis holin [Cetobacterium ceti]|uniref:Toxin secretion/phage lysis holin n=1 Tax=Cetobacterium ceti TaxID=180163 RepID=A0A1T4QZ60_9FUSO|nr:phage holin family protein [Cetobacterium ceti]SKA08628.1 toxin secretion/phage lysis holin [Cetobacterium ceti]